jgi:hypothetical protein
MFHTPSYHTPIWLSRVYHCCCEPDEMEPSTLLSAM